MKKPGVLLLLLGLLIIADGCLKPPPSFVQTTKQEWKIIKIKEGMTYEDAWQTVVETLGTQYKIDKMSQETGYIMTMPVYTYPIKKGRMSDRYPARIIVQFDKDKNECQVRVESNFITWRGPVPGSDSVLLDKVVNNLREKIGKSEK